ncbi:MAG: hypothetical protein AD073_000013 [Mycoplasmataceae bacterium]|nr:MAG: hypothetical protein AD073_000013 [Mycoplasmataceae bacterium]
MGNIIAKDRENILKPQLDNLKEKVLEISILKNIKESGITDIDVLIKSAESELEDIVSQIRNKNQELNEINKQNSIQQDQFLQEWW